LFALSQGVRDALFGHVFQSVSFFLVAALAFGAPTLCFSSLAFMRQPKDFERLAASPAAFAALNVTTAGAWLGFFFGLKHLEPALVATLYNGIRPLAVLALGGLAWAQERSGTSSGERLCYYGIAGALAALVLVVLTNRSGLPMANLLVQGGALLAVAVGGATIAVSHMIARGFNNRGVGSDAVMGTRFLLTLCISVGAEAAIGEATMRPQLAAVPLLALTAFAVITIPSFMLQLGIARASPLTVNIMRSLGPVSVFAVQQFDGRLRFSGATLVCISGFCVFAIAASVLRAWNEVRVASGGPAPKPL
jgi:drug/metabolite transporter (DMT)-like permease